LVAGRFVRDGGDVFFHAHAHVKRLQPQMNSDERG
jgi:hypothetical protein